MSDRASVQPSNAGRVSHRGCCRFDDMQITPLIIASIAPL
jgi:hypothetical protein